MCAALLVIINIMTDRQPHLMNSILPAAAAVLFFYDVTTTTMGICPDIERLPLCKKRNEQIDARPVF